MIYKLFSLSSLLKAKLARKTECGRSTEVYGDVSLATLDTMLQCALTYKGQLQDEGYVPRRMTHMSLLVRKIKYDDGYTFDLLSILESI